MIHGGNRGFGLATAVLLVTTLLVPVQLAASPSPARADDPPSSELPTSISLAASSLSFTAGQAVTLTATTDQEVSTSASTIRITDTTTSTDVASCTTGTDCTASVVFYTGGPHTYVATVNSLTSSSVVLTRAAWTVTLTSDKSAFSVGEAVALTATANQSVSGTSGNYRIAIYDTTTDAMVTTCSAGLTCAVTLAPAFYHGAPHSYVASIASTSGSTSFSSRPDSQADSNVVELARAAWTVTLTSDSTEFVAGQPVTLTATANQDVRGTDPNPNYNGPYYEIDIYDVTTDQRIQYCYSGTVCTLTSTTLYVGPDSPHTYAARIAQTGYDLNYSTAGDVQATSNAIQLAGAAWSVTLTTDSSTFAAGAPSTLIATANQDVGGTGRQYSIYIYDQTTGLAVTQCNTGTTCASSNSEFFAGPAHTFVAIVAARNDYTNPEYPDSAGVQATSNAVVLTRAAWTVTLAIDKSTFATGDYATVTANANQTGASSAYHYAVYIYDVTNDSMVCMQSSSATCSSPVGFETGGPHTFRAIVAARDNNVSTFSSLTDIQAMSNVVSLSRLGWSVSMTSSASPYPGSPQILTVNLTAVANQSTTLSGSHFAVVFWDSTEGQVAGYCNASPSCTYNWAQYAGEMHNIVALIATINHQTWAISDIQAQSNGVVPGVGSVSPGESVGGSNASEKGCQCAHADPVNTSSGEFFLNATDDGIPGVGPAVSVGRSYSTANASVDGPFGFGSTASFTSRLNVIQAGNTSDPLPRSVEVVQENGARTPFVEGADQTYAAPARVLATLTWDAVNSQWRFVRQSKQVMVFDAAGLLLSVQDLSGNAVTLSRDSAHQVIGIAGSGSRSITLTWSGSHVTQVSDSASRTVSYGYDTSGNLTSVTAVDGAVTSFGYDAAHYLTTVTKPGGGVTTNTYDSNHRVISQEDPLGRETTFAYGSSTTTTEPDGSQTVETYDSGRLVSQIRAAGTSLAETTTYTYDSANNVATETDPLGKVTGYTYDAQGHKLTRTDPLGRTTTWAYDAVGDVTSVTDPLAQVTTATYDAAGNMLTLTTPGGSVQSWTYNADGTAASWTDGRGKTTTYSYDGAGNQSASTDPDGRTQSIARDEAGVITATTDSAGKATTVTSDAAARILTVTDPNGNTTTYGYDADGNRTSVEDADGHITASAYDDADQLTSTTDANAHSTSFTYTSNGYLASKTDPLSHTTTYLYNALGLVTTVTDADNHSTLLGYDGAGRKASVTLPSGSETTVAYDDAGQVTSSTDANGKTTTYTYDLEGQRLTSTDPLDRTTSVDYTPDGHIATVTYPDLSVEHYTYDPVGQTTDFQNADGAHTTYSYDDAGLLTSKTEPGSLTTSFAYDSAARVSVTTLPDATNQSFSYDDGGRLTSIHSSISGSTDTTFTYTDVGQRATMVDATGTSSYSYDNTGLLTSQTNGAGATLGYDYDSAGQLTTLTYPGNKPVSYAYDPAGRMTSLTDWSSNETDFTWTVDGQLVSQADPNGVTQSRAYDAAGRTTNITTATSSATLADFEYAYDDAGQLTSDTSSDPINPTAVTHSYGWDPTGQLTQVTDASSTVSYAASAAGLLTGTTNGSTLSYNAAQELSGLSPPTGPATAYAYDGNGSRTSSSIAAAGSVPAATTTYSYDPAGSLASVSLPATSSSSAHTISYTSDGDGLRQSRTAASLTYDFLWDTAGGLPLLLDDGSKSYIYGPSAAPVAQVNDSTGAVRYLHPDLVGSTRVITDDAGAAVGTTQYDEYGNRTAHTGVADSAIGFSGNWTDQDTGLVNLRARDYDPATGQFITADPAVDKTRQPYAYVANNPLQLTDPTGLDFWGDVGTNALAFGAGVLDGATFGLSSAILGAVVPGYNCLTEGNGWFAAGSIVGTVVGSVAMEALTAGAATGLVVVGIAGRLAIKAAVKVAISEARRLVAAGVERVVAAVAKRGSAEVEAVERVGIDIGGARFAQKSFSETFSAEGLFGGKSIDDVASLLKSGELSPSGVPINVLVRDGNTLIANTRSAQALIRAGVPRGLWNVIDRTGDSLFERLLSGQLGRNGLTSEGFVF